MATSNRTSVKNCYNSGTINGEQVSGGIIGQGSSLSLFNYIENCYNAGKVYAASTTQAYAAGIVGFIIVLMTRMCCIRPGKHKKYCYKASDTNKCNSFLQMLYSYDSGLLSMHAASFHLASGFCDNPVLSTICNGYILPQEA